MTDTLVMRVLDVLGIQARKIGQRQWLALCPNPEHKDRHPSWRIRDDAHDKRNGYHACWACGFQGGLIGLIAKVRGVEMKDAHALLDKIKEGVAIEPRPVPQKVQTVVRRRGEFILPAGVVVKPFSLWPKSARECDYLKKRGITEEQIDAWEIGIGLAGTLDNRIVFITRDRHGEVKNYTARWYLPDREDKKRYLEPEAWEKADRGTMFGEQFWPINRLMSTVVVVEGASKGLAVERAVPEFAVASMAGSAVLPAYLIKLVTFGHVIIATDSDETGDRICADLSFVLRKQRVSHSRLRLRDGVDLDEIPDDERRGLLLERCGAVKP